MFRIKGSINQLFGLQISIPKLALVIVENIHVVKKCLQSGIPAHFIESAEIASIVQQDGNKFHCMVALSFPIVSVASSGRSLVITASLYVWGIFRLAFWLTYGLFPQFQSQSILYQVSAFFCFRILHIWSGPCYFLALLPACYSSSDKVGRPLMPGSRNAQSKAWK